MTLYDFELDENCYKVRLLLSMLGLAFDLVAVDAFPGREETEPALLALNPCGRLPILRDGETNLHGAEAILLYLAYRYDHERLWLPSEPAAFGQVATWLHFATFDLDAAHRARKQALFEAGSDDTPFRDQARQALRIMDDHMTMRGFDGHNWFVGDNRTIADIALFPAIALSRDFGVDHEAYPALRKWMRDGRALKGFITMPGIPSYY